MAVAVERPRIFDSIESAHQHAISGFGANGFTHQMTLMKNPETFSLVLEHLMQIPLLTFRGHTSPFAHSQILSSDQSAREAPPTRSDKQYLQPNDAFSSTQLHTKIRHLLSQDVQKLTFTKFLSKLHVLIAVIFAAMFQALRSGKPPEFPQLGAAVELLSLWEKHFKANLPQHLSTDLSAWQAWVIAESCRRTVLVLPWISGVIEYFQTGCCSYRPFVESLPFDARTGLWEAATEDEWNAALECHTGPGPGEPDNESSLVSWCEFIEDGGASPRPRFDGMLQRLFLVAYYGVESQLPPNQQSSFHPKFRSSVR
ncbi:uncharacterized protein A1O9_00306 [Exophiala aquamarina CBS 119918]|uniref:Transcription factor domain-containing protein n=1 Tax=Exophiala aquamarina CBS 119918 TaxID=1182545 RepID=A0A072PQH5_9EURO|nr:uncharacterized protein A1O9_00306 [Exophiala aquamarina CBS 119918]KEF62334.1 hypothetical protein A1O9_00306 [Exophiala aquamarina CBS 119918]